MYRRVRSRPAVRLQEPRREHLSPHEELVVFRVAISGEHGVDGGLDAPGVDVGAGGELDAAGEAGLAVEEDRGEVLHVRTPNIGDAIGAEGRLELCLEVGGEHPREVLCDERRGVELVDTSLRPSAAVAAAALVVIHSHLVVLIV